MNIYIDMKILFWFLAFLTIVSMLFGFYKETKGSHLFAKVIACAWLLYLALTFIVGI